MALHVNNLLDDDALKFLKQRPLLYGACFKRDGLLKSKQEAVELLATAMALVAAMFLTPMRFWERESESESHWTDSCKQASPPDKFRKKKVLLIKLSISIFLLIVRWQYVTGLAALETYTLSVFEARVEHFFFSFLFSFVTKRTTFTQLQQELTVALYLRYGEKGRPNFSYCGEQGSFLMSF